MKSIEKMKNKKRKIVSKHSNMFERQQQRPTIEVIVRILCAQSLWHSLQWIIVTVIIV